MDKEYTYYGFWDNLCGEEEYDSYRLGPNGLEFQYKSFGEYHWAPSSWDNMEDLLADALTYGKARYWEIDVDG